MQTPVRAISLPASRRHWNPGFLIMAAAILHVSVALTVFAIGKYQLFPSQIYPTGVGRFASDGIMYEGQVIELSKIARNEGLRAWATWPTQLHVRLYSIPLASGFRWVGLNILTIEPLNLIYYVTILALVFKLSESLFGYRTGLVAATIVGLWPSFLLHTTQLLRDPLLISALLVVIWSLVACIKQKPAWRRGLLLGALTVVAIPTIRIVRLPFWGLLCIIIGTAVLIITLRAIRERKVAAGAIIFMIMIIAAVVITPRFQSSFRNQQQTTINRFIIPEEAQKLTLDDQIKTRRLGFQYRMDEAGNILPAEDGSQIDTDIQFHSFGDIIRHVPRAIMIGFFAPFPNMWLSAGKQVGFSGRVISGIEMVLTYMIESLAVLGLWSARKTLSAWFLVVVIGLGATALGLVVNNMGAMYRLRYPFWVLLVILGAGGISFLFGRFRNQGSQRVDNPSGRELSI
jgi:hypothetical protein